MPDVTRRDAIALGAVGTLAAACSSETGGPKRRVAVVGAGIIGASIAYHLAKAGSLVTVLDRYEIATRASRGTFAWLNATWAKQPRQYHRLNQLGLAGWQELERDLAIPIKWGGSLEWFEDTDRQALLGQQLAEQVEWGEPARMVPRSELSTLEPNVNFGSVVSAGLSPNDGALDPVLAARTLLERAIELGAEVKINCPVSEISRSDDSGISVIETAQGSVEVDAVVLATGADPNATKTLAGIDIPQRSTPGVIVVTEPIEPLINRIAVAPGVHIHQRLDGRVVLGEQDGAPQTQAHATRLAARPNQFPTPELANEHAGRILAIAERFVPGIASAKIEDVYIGWRPLPLDGHPVMGFASRQSNTYLAIAHSGVSLAPILGKLAAQEVLEGIEVELLSNYRPTRQFEEVRRY